MIVDLPRQRHAKYQARKAVFIVISFVVVWESDDWVKLVQGDIWIQHIFFLEPVKFHLI